MDIKLKYKDGDISKLLDELEANPMLGTLLKSLDLRSAFANISAEAEVKAIDQGATAMVTAVQPIFAGGRIINGNKLASVGVEAAEYQQVMAEQNSLIQVEKSYWLVVSLMEKRQTVASLETLLDTLSRDVRSGFRYVLRR